MMIINVFNNILDKFIKAYLMCFTGLIRYYIVNVVLSFIYTIVAIFKGWI